MRRSAHVRSLFSVLWASGVFPELYRPGRVRVAAPHFSAWLRGWGP